MKNVIVIGGGPAGMFAALSAAENGHAVTLLEKNEKLGKKLFITGKGRCNLTNAGDMDALFGNVVTNPKFLYSAFYACDNRRVIEFFERRGMPTKTERGNRVFPVSDHSSDVIAVLKQALARAGVQVRLHTEVSEILKGEEKITGVSLKNGRNLPCDAVVLATGGYSYQSTGSTGDGYLFAGVCGHTVTALKPSLVPLTAKEPYVKQMQGLSLKNVGVTIRREQKVLFEDFGEMLFTHFGVSGPLILRASSLVGKELNRQPLAMAIDLKPALNEHQLDQRLLREFGQNKNKRFKNSVHGLLPAKMIPVLIQLSGIDPDKKINEMTRQERGGLITLLKAFPVTLTGMRDFNEAIITKGGISVKEVNPSIAWSTGYLAGCSIK